MAFPIDSPLPVFYDRNGSVLDAGYVYIGTVNLNPITNPVSVFWDADETIPAPQPLRTVRGYIARNGAPATLYVRDDFSIVVRDRNQQLVLNEPNSAEIARIESVIGRQSYASLADLRATPALVLAPGQTRVVNLLAHTGGTGVGGGQFRWDAASTATDDNALVVNPTGNPGAGRWLRMYEGNAQVTYWGATGDGTTDDTSAIQSAVNWATGTADGVGKGLFFPGSTTTNVNSNYRITSAISIGRSQGWRFVGSSRFNTTITQATNNTAIFNFTRELTHSWAVTDMALTWATAQTSAQTVSKCFYFNSNVFTGGGFHKWEVSRVTMSNCYEGFGYNTSSVNQICWSFILDNIFISSFSNGIGTFVPSPSFGQPGISIRNVYGFNDNNPAGVYFLRLSNALGFTIDNIELNNAADIGMFNILGSNGSIGSARIEQVSYSGTYANGVIFNQGDSFIRAGTLEFTSSVMNVGTNASVFLVNNAGTVGDWDIGSVVTAGAQTYTSGAICVVLNSTKTRQTKIDAVSLNGGGGGVPVGLARISNTGGSDFTRVRAWSDDNVSFNNGTTTPIQLVVGDAPVQYYSTAITGDQVIRLPDVAGTVVGTQTIANAVQGLRYRIVRTSTATGAFNINVQTSTGAALHTLAAAANAVEFMWNRLAGWVKVEAGTIA